MLCTGNDVLLNPHTGNRITNRNFEWNGSIHKQDPFSSGCSLKSVSLCVIKSALGIMQSYFHPMYSVFNVYGRVGGEYIQICLTIIVGTLLNCPLLKSSKG